MEHFGESGNHRIGDARCPECAEDFPEPCRCGGLVHATVVQLQEAENPMIATRCDQCGRSDEDLAEAV